MADSPILKIPQLATTTSNKEDFINDIASIIERSLNKRDSVDLSSGNDLLTKTEFTRAGSFDCTGHSVARILGLPYEATATDGVRFFHIKNSGTSAGVVTVQVDDGTATDVARGTTVAIAIGELSLLYTDGTNVELVNNAASVSGQTYDFGFSKDGIPASSEVLNKVIIPRAITIPADMAGSYGHIDANPTASFAIDVQDDGASIGTITVSTGGAFTFVTTSGTAKSVAAGSRITFVAPGSADATADWPAATIQATID
jgi:hypothetical protein